MLVLLLLPRLLWAEWLLEQSGDGHWISSRAADFPHQLVVASHQNDVQFLLILATDQRTPASQLPAEIRVDMDPWLSTQLTPLQQRPYGMAFRIELRPEARQKMVQRMIEGLQMQLSLGSEKQPKQTLTFSIIGFTDAYTDLQISNELGRLDPDWLIEQGKDRGLACYYSAILTVQALNGRRRGLSARQMVEQLPRTGLASVDDRRADIVSGAYRMPPARLPRHLTTLKYKLFKSCMRDQ